MRKGTGIQRSIQNGEKMAAAKKESPRTLRGRPRKSLILGTAQDKAVKRETVNVKERSGTKRGEKGRGAK